MKKNLIVLALVAAAAGAAAWPQLRSWFFQNPQLIQMVQENQTLSALRQQVVTGGALRSLEGSSGELSTEGVEAFTNQARSVNGGLAPLSRNSRLDKAAMAKLADMLQGQYFEHVSPSGVGPADLAAAAGYQYVIIGENLALGNFQDDEALVQAWMNSPGHRANILNPKFQEIGLAVGRGRFEGRQVWLAVQEFGKPLSSCPTVDAALKSRIDNLRSEIDLQQSQLAAVKAEIDAHSASDTAEGVAVYNDLVAQYNSLARIHNNKVDLLKQAVAQYNGQVQEFNDCAK